MLYGLLPLAFIALVFGKTPTTVEEIAWSNTHEYNDVDARPDKTVCVTTRDGICLSTDIYYGTKGTKPWPCVYAKTPYGKGSLASLAGEWNKEGYCVIAQDCRGRHASGGKYSFWRTSGNDSMDTISWMLEPAQQDFSDGFAGIQGVSADALAQYADITGVTQGGLDNFNKNNDLLNHGKVGYLIWGDGLGKQTAYQSGAYRTGLISGWLDLILEPGMVHEVLENEQFNEWWYPLVGNWTEWDPSGHPGWPQWEITNLTIVHSSGWYDIFSNNQLKTAFGANTTGQENCAGDQILIVDPGGHCGGGAIKWPNGSYAANIMSDTYAPAIFNGAMEAAKNNELFDVHKYVPWNALFYFLGPGLTGSEGNYWVAAESLPPFSATSYFLDGSNGNDNGVLSDTAPTAGGSNSYTYDPNDPVRTHGGNNLILEPCGPQSQAHNEDGRKDILHFTSAKLKTNTALVGMIIAQLYVGSDCVDTDFTAKVIDIFPDGTPMLVQDGILRMRWRDGPYTYNVSAPMVTGRVYEISIEVGYMAYIFNAGHQISLSVSSSNFKRFSVNYNNGNFVIDGDKDSKVANNTVYYGSTHPSKLILPIIDLEWAHARKVAM